MTDHDFTVGQRVRFTIDSLGSMRKDGTHGNKFEADKFGVADTGTVTLVDLPDGWVAVEPDGHPDLYVPVRPGMIEATDD